jgi:hypothetical protein
LADPVFEGVHDQTPINVGQAHRRAAALPAPLPAPAVDQNRHAVPTSVRGVITDKTRGLLVITGLVFALPQAVQLAGSGLARDEGHTAHSDQHDRKMSCATFSADLCNGFNGKRDFRPERGKTVVEISICCYSIAPERQGKTNEPPNQMSLWSVKSKPIPNQTPTIP